MRTPSPNPQPSIAERAQFALDNPDIQHSPADLREIIAGLLAATPRAIGAPDGWGVFALIAPGVYCLQSVIRHTREESETDASRFVRGCDAHARPLYAGARQ